MVIVIETDQIDDVDVYPLQLKASVIDNEMSFVQTTLSATTSFDLKVLNGCREDLIEPIAVDVPSVEMYEIGEGQTNQITFKWRQLQQGCPKELEFVIVENETNLERSLTKEEAAVVAVTEDLANDSAVISIKTTDF